MASLPKTTTNATASTTEDQEIRFGVFGKLWSLVEEHKAHQEKSEKQWVDQMKGLAESAAIWKREKEELVIQLEREKREMSAMANGKNLMASLPKTTKPTASTTENQEIRFGVLGKLFSLVEEHKAHQEKSEKQWVDNMKGLAESAAIWKREKEELEIELEVELEREKREMSAVANGRI